MLDFGAEHETHAGQIDFRSATGAQANIRIEEASDPFPPVTELLDRCIARTSVKFAVKNT